MGRVSRSNKILCAACDGIVSALILLMVTCVPSLSERHAYDFTCSVADVGVFLVIRTVLSLSATVMAWRALYLQVSLVQYAGCILLLVKLVLRITNKHCWDVSPSKLGSLNLTLWLPLVAELLSVIFGFLHASQLTVESFSAKFGDSAEDDLERSEDADGRSPARSSLAQPLLVPARDEESGSEGSFGSCTGNLFNKWGSFQSAAESFSSSPAATPPDTDPLPVLHADAAPSARPNPASSLGPDAKDGGQLSSSAPILLWPPVTTPSKDPGNAQPRALERASSAGSGDRGRAAGGAVAPGSKGVEESDTRWAGAGEASGGGAGELWTVDTPGDTAGHLRAAMANVEAMSTTGFLGKQKVYKVQRGLTMYRLDPAMAPAGLSCWEGGDPQATPRTITDNILLATLQVPHPPEAVLDVLFDVQLRNKWDSFCDFGHLIQQHNPHSRESYMRYKSLWPIAVRDVHVVGACKKMPNDDLLLAVLSHPHSALAVERGVVRAKMVFGGYRVTPVGRGDSSCVNMCMLLDLAAPIPASLRAQLNVQLVFAHANLDKVIAKRKQAARVGGSAGR